MVEQEAGVKQGGTIMLAAWELKILSDYPEHRPETEHEKHKAAEDMFFPEIGAKTTERRKMRGSRMPGDGVQA